MHGLTMACSAGARVLVPAVQAGCVRVSPAALCGEQSHLFGEQIHRSSRSAATAAVNYLLDDSQPCEWSEDDVVQLHWRLLLDLRSLGDPETPLEDKFDMLRWVFSDPKKDAVPFSFVSCVRVAGCSPLSPTAYFGSVDVDEIRQWIRRNSRQWLVDTLDRYPAWARELVLGNLDWAAQQLDRNPQWLNEQVKCHQGADLFSS